MIYNSLYNTYPSTLHSPGLIHDFFNKAKSKIFDAKYKFNNCGDLTIVTWNNTRHLGIFERCLNHFGLSYQVLGKKIVNWHNPVKIELLLEAISGIQTKYILAADAFDVLLFHDPNHIVKKFKSLNCKMIYNGEAKNHPNEPGFGEFEWSIGKDFEHPYLNAGVFIGETKFCNEFYSEIYKRHKDKEGFWRKVEQAHIRSTFPDFHPSVKIDYQCDLFQVLSKTEDSLLEHVYLQ